MYVVRIIVDDEKSDYKVYDSRSDAQDRYNAAVSYALRDEVESAALFEVERSDVRSAANAIISGDKNGVHLLEFEECTRRKIQRIAQNLELDL